MSVTLADAPRSADRLLPEGTSPDDVVVHQQDVQGVVNALWAGGAEAMQIMDQRVIATSAVRCVGNTLILQGRVYSPPYTITAIGDPERLSQALDDSSEGRALSATTSTRYGLVYGPSASTSHDAARLRRARWTCCTPRSPRDAVRRAARLGEVFITAGVVLLLFVRLPAGLDQLRGRPGPRTGWPTTSADGWDRPPAGSGGVTVRGPKPVDFGKGFAFLHIPRLGQELERPDRPGRRACPTCRAASATTPETALPGQVGNFAVAGHRATNGEPFAYLDQVGKGDSVVVETRRQLVHLRRRPHPHRVARPPSGCSTRCPASRTQSRPSG